MIKFGRITICKDNIKNPSKMQKEKLETRDKPNKSFQSTTSKKQVLSYDKNASTILFLNIIQVTLKYIFVESLCKFN